MTKLGSGRGLQNDVIDRATSVFIPQTHNVCQAICLLELQAPSITATYATADPIPSRLSSIGTSPTEGFLLIQCPLKTKPEQQR